MRNSWSNYFRKQGDGKTEDEKYAKAMWKAIASPNFKSDNPESKNNLNSRHMRAPEGERPSREAPKKEYWCEDHKNLKWYEVAAQHILHEMTHFDSAGKQAGLPEYT